MLIKDTIKLVSLIE